jgi:hypothetical protein
MDNAMFYLGYAAATMYVPRWKKIAVAVYTFTVMTLWMTTYTVNPLAVDTNSTEYLDTFYTVSLLIYTWGNVIYNIYFTIEFIIILYRVYHMQSKQYSKTAIAIAQKCILHCLSR